MEDCGSPTRTDRDVSLMRALRSSVSFGRFVSESLDWGKWSSFRYNRYLEDAKRYSVRGSVADKKAFFEAHYQKKLAKLEVGLDNSNTQNGHEGELGASVTDSSNYIEPLDISVQSQNFAFDVASDQEEEVLDAGASNDFLIPSIDRIDLDKENYWLDINDVKFNAFDVSLTELGVQQVVEDIENQKSGNGIEVDRIRQSDQPPLKEITSNERNVKDTNILKAPIPKPTFVHESPKVLPLPEKDVSPVLCMKENKSPSITKLCREKKKSALRAIRMSADSYQPRTQEISPSLLKTSSVLEKIKAFTYLSRASQDCSQTARKRSSTGSGDHIHHHLKTPSVTASRAPPVSKPMLKVSDGHSQTSRTLPSIPSKASSSSSRSSIIASPSQGTNVAPKPSQADSRSSKMPNSGRKHARIQSVLSSLSIPVDEKADKSKDGSSLQVCCYAKDNVVSDQPKRLQLQSKGQATLKCL